MKRVTSVLLTLLIAIGESPLGAYERPSHGDIAEQSAQPSVSKVDTLVREELMLPAGVTMRFRGRCRPRQRTIAELIADGADCEDAPFFRVLRHFHNPVADSWESAGLFGIFQSSVLWQQNAGQDGVAGGGNWSWQDARRRFLEALTHPTKDDSPDRKGRDTAFGELFEALGRLSHLIQDASVPAHVRNDPHLIRDGYERHVHRLQQAPAGSGRRARFDEWLNRTPVRPPDTIFSPTGHPQAPVPIARLIDTNLFLGGNFDVLGRPDLGIAEYTNGNFLSDDTMFDDFVLPRRSGLGQDFFEPEGGRFRRYFEKTSVEGEAIRHFVAESALYEAALAEAGPMAEALTLTRRTYEDYAEFLLPRAVGYSAALLDYFFRGKLDVDVVSDDGSTLQLRGTNASTDALVDGTLKLYADVETVDEANNPITVRRELTALGDTTVRGVEHGQALSSALFQSQEAERFVAVYQGRLGNEVPVLNPAAPALSFPGGVIGKVLGGVRVEEVFLDFADGGKWKLRTPRGIAPLKVEGREAWLAYPAVENLRWGEGQDQLVGRTAFGPGQPNQIVAYTVPRQPNSVELATETAPEGPLVRLRVIAERAFPFGLALGTQVTVSHTIDYQQQLVDYGRRVVLQWTQPPGVPFGQYVFAEEKFGPTRLRTVANETFSFVDSFAVTLDLAHYSQFTSPTEQASYGWTLTEVGLTAAGQLVGVIRVNLAAPAFFRWPVVSQPVYGLDANGAVVVRRSCGTFLCFDETVGLRRTFPLGANPLLWAVVDLATGEVLAKTAEDVLTIASREAMEAPRWTAQALGPAPLVYHQEITERVGGGPNDGVTNHGWFAEGVRVWDRQAFSTQTQLTLSVSAAQSLAGMLRAEVSRALSDLGFLQAALVRPAPSPTSLAFGPFGAGQRVLEVITPVSGPFSPLATLEDAQRTRGTTDSERLVLLAEGSVVGQGTFDGLVAWDPSAAQARGLLKARLGVEAEGLVLGSATKTLAIVGAFVEGGGYLVALDGTAPPRFVPDPDGLFFYQALEPQYVYNVATERFHSARVTAEGVSELQPTALPLVLKNGPNGPVGDYHAIRLP